MNKRGGVLAKLTIVVMVLAVAVVGVGYFLLTRLNSIVAGKIEKHGSEITGTKVNVSSVDIKLAKGRGTFKGLRVANPEGFSGKSAFSLGEVTLDIDIKSVTKEPIIIEEILVDSSRVMFEVKAAIDLSNLENISGATSQILNSSNLFQIKSNIEKAVGQRVEDTGPEKKIIIKKFTFQSGQVAISVPSLGIQNMTVDIPSINLSDLGGSGGAAPKDIGKEIAMAFSKEVAKVVEKAFMEIVKNEFKKKIRSKLQGKIEDKLGSGAKNLLNNIFK